MKMTKALVTAALLASAGLATTASATTLIYASRAEFVAAATSPIATETFESFPELSTTATLRFSNGAIFATSPIFVSESFLCTPGQGKCLNSSLPNDTRLFGEFANSTTGFALDLRGFAPDDLINVSVMTGEGLFRTSIVSAVSFLGFTNARGITSVTFNNVGRTNGIAAYTFDNISTFTGTITSVPEPTSWAMIIFGVGAVGASLRRRSLRATVRFA